MAALLLRALPLADWREGGALVGLLALLAYQPLLSLEEAALTLSPTLTLTLGLTLSLTLAEP